MSRFCLVIFLLLIPLISNSQYSETIRSGRPGASIGAFTVGSKVLQTQTGVNIGKLTGGINTSREGLVVRYGLLERLEFSGLIAYSDIAQRGGFEYQQKGLSAAQLGFRVNFLDGKGTSTSIGFQSRLKLNVLSEDFNQPDLGTTSILIISQPMGSKLGLTANLGVNTPGNHDTGGITGLYTLNLSMPVSQRWSVFLENYGTWFAGEAYVMFDGGFAVLVNPDLQLDLSLGYGKNDKVQDYYVDFGFSWRTQFGGKEIR
jgi:hypothetical protein